MLRCGGTGVRWRRRLWNVTRSGADVTLDPAIDVRALVFYDWVFENFAFSFCQKIQWQTTPNKVYTPSSYSIALKREEREVSLLHKQLIYLSLVLSGASWPLHVSLFPPLLNCFSFLVLILILFHSSHSGATRRLGELGHWFHHFMASHQSYWRPLLPGPSPSPPSLTSIVSTYIICYCFEF